MPPDPRYQHISYFQWRFRPISVLKLTGNYDVRRKQWMGIGVAVLFFVIGVTLVNTDGVAVGTVLILAAVLVLASAGSYARRQAKLAADEWNMKR